MPGRFSAADLAAANINPQTGLATDYLNHFNEAIMLLEMIPSMPDCAEDFFGWAPLSYAEHFTASNFKGRDLAIAAYNIADAQIRGEFDAVTHAMTAILIAIRDAMAKVQKDDSRAKLADEAVSWLKPLVAQAGSIINGTPLVPDVAAEQADVDYILSH